MIEPLPGIAGLTPILRSGEMKPSVLLALNAELPLSMLPPTTK